VKRQLSGAVLATVRYKEVDVIWTKLYSFKLIFQFFGLFLDKTLGSKDNT